MQHKTLGLFCTVAALSLVSGKAQAQISEGALQLGVGTNLLTYTSSSVTDSLADGTKLTSDTGAWRWGLAERSGVLFEGGYGIGDSLVLGGLLGLGGWSDKVKVDRAFADEDKRSVFDLYLAPKLDYMLLPGGTIRPFFGGALGLVHHSEGVESKDGRTGVTTTPLDRSLTGLWLMARAGARFFLTPGFSIDPALTFSWIPTASGSIQGNNTASYDSKANSVSIGLTLGMSGWLGF